MIGIVVVIFSTGIMGLLYSIFCSLYWVYLLMLFTALFLIVFTTMGCLQQPLHWPVCIHLCSCNTSSEHHPKQPSPWLSASLPSSASPTSASGCLFSILWALNLMILTVRDAAVSPSMLIIVLHFMLPRVFMRLHLNKERSCYV